MSHERNIEGLRRSAQHRHQEAVQRTENGIHQLLKENRPVNFRTVSDAARVSTAWLYQQEEVRRRIEHLRLQETHGSRKQTPKRPDHTSKNAIVETLRHRVKQLEEENRSLKQQIEVLYGQLYKQ